jgi:hypothetical protein
MSFTVQRTFRTRDMKKLALHGINGHSAGNYQLMDEESAEGMGVRQELPVHRRRIYPRKGIPPGMTSPFHTSKIKMSGKSSER